MQNMLSRYKHYFIVIAALLMALYITDPMWAWYQELKQSKQMQQVRSDKTSQLLAQQQMLQGELEKARITAKSLAPYLFHQADESELKLAVQKKLEVLLQKADCEMERIGWEGQIALDQQLSKWQLNVRFKGAPLCLVGLTRALDTQKPLMRVSGYRFNANNWQGEARERINGDVSISIWHSPEPVKSPEPVNSPESAVDGPEQVEGEE